jgi:hypothetical protein
MARVEKGMIMEHLYAARTSSGKDPSAEELKG